MKNYYERLNLPVNPAQGSNETAQRIQTLDRELQEAKSILSEPKQQKEYILQLISQMHTAMIDAISELPNANNQSFKGNSEEFKKSLLELLQRLAQDDIKKLMTESEINNVITYYSNLALLSKPGVSLENIKQLPHDSIQYRDEDTDALKAVYTHNFAKVFTSLQDPKIIINNGLPWIHMLPVTDERIRLASKFLSVFEDQKEFLEKRIFCYMELKNKSVTDAIDIINAIKNYLHFTQFRKDKDLLIIQFAPLAIRLLLALPNRNEEHNKFVINLAKKIMIAHRNSDQSDKALKLINTLTQASLPLTIEDQYFINNVEITLLRPRLDASKNLAYYKPLHACLLLQLHFLNQLHPNVSAQIQRLSAQERQPLTPNKAKSRSQEYSKLYSDLINITTLKDDIERANKNETQTSIEVVDDDNENSNETALTLSVTSLYSTALKVFDIAQDVTLEHIKKITEAVAAYKIHEQILRKPFLSTDIITHINIWKRILETIRDFAIFLSQFNKDILHQANYENYHSLDSFKASPIFSFVCSTVESHEPLLPLNETQLQANADNETASVLEQDNGYITSEESSDSSTDDEDPIGEIFAPFRTTQVYDEAKAQHFFDFLKDQFDLLDSRLQSIHSTKNKGWFERPKKSSAAAKSVNNKRERDNVSSDQWNEDQKQKIQRR